MQYYLGHFWTEILTKTDRNGPKRTKKTETDKNIQTQTESDNFF